LRREQSAQLLRVVRVFRQNIPAIERINEFRCDDAVRIRLFPGEWLFGLWLWLFVRLMTDAPPTARVFAYEQLGRLALSIGGFGLIRP
jgi:hypothetical protein